MDEAKQIQQQDLWTWKAILKPDAYRKLIEAVKQQGKVTDPYDVLRGDSLGQLVADMRNAARKDFEQAAMGLQTAFYIVMVLGYWGRGKTVKEAAIQCKEQGAKSGQRAIVRLFIGDETPEVSKDGDLLYEAWAEMYRVADGISLGSLCQLAA